MTDETTPACPTCGFVPGAELGLPDYEELWATSPGLAMARARNAQVNCTTCSRLLTFQVGGDAGFQVRPDGAFVGAGPSRGPSAGDPGRVAEIVANAGKLLGRSTT